ncbi:MAG TPA: hypothetical protein VG366_01200 [Solirubrobacteraceae bacterium]|nr:hypothetical protein [Solirubrobacteraceae bacterium]
MRAPAVALASLIIAGGLLAPSDVQGLSAGWRAFGAGSWPGAGWRPYAKTSPFNQPVGKSAVHPSSAQLVAGALQWGAPTGITAGVADTAHDYGHPVYFAQPTDPVYVLHPTAPWGRNPLAGVRIRVPAGARPAGGGDGHMTIVMPEGWEYDLWQAQAPPPGGGTLSFAWGGRLRIDGSGLGGRATAAHFGSLAGIIRPEELAAGHINHALFIVLRCTGSGASFGYGVHPSTSRWTSGYVYPAQAGASSCGLGATALPPLGARFQLAMSGAQIAALRVPAWKRAILTALARYGGYVGDTGGPGFAFMVQSSSTYTSFGAPDRLVQLARSVGLSSRGGSYLFDISDGVDWQRYLRIVVPPAVQRSTPQNRGIRASTRMSVRSAGR